jgi:hypothetical protein
VPKEHHDVELILFGVVYIVLALVVLAGSRREVPRLLRDGFRTKYSDLVAADPPHNAH